MAEPPCISVDLTQYDEGAPPEPRLQCTESDMPVGTPVAVREAMTALLATTLAGDPGAVTVVVVLPPPVPPDEAPVTVGVVPSGTVASGAVPPPLFVDPAEVLRCRDLCGFGFAAEADGVFRPPVGVAVAEAVGGTGPAAAAGLAPSSPELSATTTTPTARTAAAVAEAMTIRRRDLAPAFTSAAGVGGSRRRPTV